MQCESPVESLWISHNCLILEFGLSTATAMVILCHMIASRMRNSSMMTQASLRGNVGWGRWNLSWIWWNGVEDTTSEGRARTFERTLLMMRSRGLIAW
jgi:hypothetical protein